MNDRFTEKARNAIEKARCAAAELGHSYIGTEHLLLGIVRESDALGSRVLRENGFIFSSGEVVAVGVPDEPGGLSRLLQILAEKQIDVQYMYSIFGQPNGMAYMILRVAAPAEASALLRANDMHLAGAAELGIVSSDQERQE